MRPPFSVSLLTDDIRYGFSMHSLLSALRPHVHFHLCRSEEEIIQYLKGVGIYGNRDNYPVPNLLLLDSNHPKSHDLFVLQWIKDQTEFRNLPIIFLADQQDLLVKQAFDLGSNACAVLRQDLNSLCEIIDGIYELRGIFAHSQETISGRQPL